MAALTALAASAALAACTSDAEPSPLPAPPSSTAASPSPSATPPTLPAEAEGTSPAAAKAFARHYFDLINYAARTGDTTGLRQLGTPDCVSCNAIARNIEKIYNAGGHIAAERWEILRVDVLKATGQRATLSLGTFLHPEVTVAADGTRTRKVGGKQPMTMFLRLEPTGIRVTKLDLVT